MCLLHPVNPNCFRTSMGENVTEYILDSSDSESDDVTSDSDHSQGEEYKDDQHYRDV